MERCGALPHTPAGRSSPCTPGTSATCQRALTRHGERSVQAQSAKPSTATENRAPLWGDGRGRCAKRRQPQRPSLQASKLPNFRGTTAPLMARLEGFEPPTRGLEGRCSIQLSYRRKRCLIGRRGRPSPSSLRLRRGGRRGARGRGRCGNRSRASSRRRWCRR